MYSHVASDDPNYRCDPAAFIRTAVESLTKYAVVPDPALGAKLIEINDRSREIRVRPGEPFDRFHMLLGRAALYVIGGSAWAPEYHVRPQLYVVRDKAG